MYRKSIFTLTLAMLCVGCVRAGGPSDAQFDHQALKMISDEDMANMRHIVHHMDKDYSEFKSVDEVHMFLDKVKLLVQKHPKNVAFASGDLKALFKLLSEERTTKLIRVDTEPFVMPITDERMQIAQRAIESDELTRKLFGGPVRALVEARRQHLSRAEGGDHKDGNFFTNFWCKISGGCSNQ